jgi:hypothetical protein
MLHGQQPVVPPKPSPAAVEEIPVIEGTIPDIAANTVPHFFTQEQFSALQRLADVIYPESNGIPGAVAARVPEFLDFLIGESPEPRQQLYRDGLDQLNSRAHEHFGKPFASASSSQADTILAPLCQTWTAAPPDSYTAFLRAAKEDIFDGTRNSHEWIKVMSKRVRSAGGLGMYWFPID